MRRSIQMTICPSKRLWKRDDGRSELEYTHIHKLIKKTVMETIYHYTSVVQLEKILHDGFLKVSETDRKYGIKPAIWFSKNTDWEPTATKKVFNGEKVVQLSKEEQLNSIGIARIGIPFSKHLISWRKYRHVGNIHANFHAILEQVGIEKGSRPSDWFCSLKNVPGREWVSVEYYDGSRWQKIMEIGHTKNYPSVLTATEKG